ncbi:hypothetical protein [Hyunsoonleella rubra]|uniref:Integrase n=1 Tax=Hyunsoonleella rubra TaxID=1737062 RepID=A0ABW5TAQ1_9FLAO
MLYSKEKEYGKRSYAHLYIHTTSEQVHRLQRKGKVKLNGTPKK